MVCWSFIMVWELFVLVVFIISALVVFLTGVHVEVRENSSILEAIDV